MFVAVIPCIVVNRKYIVNTIISVELLNFLLIELNCALLTIKTLSVASKGLLWQITKLLQEVF